MSDCEKCGNARRQACDNCEQTDEQAEIDMLEARIRELEEAVRVLAYEVKCRRERQSAHAEDFGRCGDAADDVDSNPLARAAVEASQ